MKPVEGGTALPIRKTTIELEVCKRQLWFDENFCELFKFDTPFMAYRMICNVITVTKHYISGKHSQQLKSYALFCQLIS
jgi:hypothetical protein